VSYQPNVLVITGATGFTGRYVVAELGRRFPGVRRRCLVRAASNREVLNDACLEYVVGDLWDEASLREAFRGADTLVHVASLGFGWIDPLFSAIGSSSLRRGLFMSTTATLTKLPVRSKPIRMRAEALVASSGLDWTILRPTMIYGTPYDRNIARLVRFVMRSPVIPVAAPLALQQPVHVEDVARAVADALASERTGGRAYNLAGREPIHLHDLVRETIEAVGRPRVILPVPMAPILALAWLYNAVVRRSRLTVEQVRRLQEDKHVGYEQASADFGFAPRSFRDGVREEVHLIQQHLNA
jgi:uncharacterized protein YbjT (DUF2867 family)